MSRENYNDASGRASQGLLNDEGEGKREILWTLQTRKQELRNQTACPYAEPKDHTTKRSMANPFTFLEVLLYLPPLSPCSHVGNQENARVGRM